MTEGRHRRLFHSRLFNYAFLRCMDMNMPRTQSPVKMKKQICMVRIRSAAGTSYRDTLPMVPLTTSVIIAIPMVCPDVRMVETIELATANFCGGTQLMITFVFGDEKSAIPNPAAASAMQTVHKGISADAKAKNSNVSAHTAMPDDASL